MVLAASVQRMLNSHIYYREKEMTELKLEKEASYPPSFSHPFSCAPPLLSLMLLSAGLFSKLQISLSLQPAYTYITGEIP